ncbi:MAG: hypothetical protein RJQ09_21550 [Cyclobacteriaceae bacterium]
MRLLILLTNLLISGTINAQDAPSITELLNHTGSRYLGNRK